MVEKVQTSVIRQVNSRGSAGKESASNAGDAVQPLGWEAAHGGANGNPSSILA